MLKMAAFAPPDGNRQDGEHREAGLAGRTRGPRMQILEQQRFHSSGLRRR